MIEEEIFSRGRSLMHRLDPRVKVIIACSLAVVTALSWSYQSIFLALFTGLVLLCLARLDFLLILKRVVLVNTFVGFLWLTLPFTYEGETVWQWGLLDISLQGVELVALLTIKVNALVMIFIALLATSRIADIGSSLRFLGVPEKFCLLLLSSYRYVFVIAREYQRLSRAARLRGFAPGTNLHTYRTYGHLFGMTLVRSWNRARTVNQAMLLRGFQGRFFSTVPWNIKVSDHVFSFLLLTITAVIILLNQLYPGMY